MTGNATNAEKSSRAVLVQATRRHNIPVVAVVFTTPPSECIARQADRTPDRAVPEHVIRIQDAAITAALPGLRDEGIDHIVQVHRLEALLQRADDTRRAELGTDGHAGLGDLLLVRRSFGTEVLPLWQWLDEPALANGDRVGEIRLGPDHLTLALRTDSDGEGDIGFEILTRCPVFADCTSPAWAPARDVTDLLQAVTGNSTADPDTYCTDHGRDDPEGRADLYQQYPDAVGA
ncbi:AAA family ATPase [Streptomyces sp. NPDC052095]|uniref:AAA family ATPase n=1 Tax=unclassified Streptomyces TaxID=2593676 RepID=UPI00344B03EF